MKNVFVLFGVLVILGACNRDKIEFNPPKGSHIIIIGNTFADRMQYHSYFEAALQKNFPAHNLVIRNMGWSADEPYLQPRPLNFGSMNEHLADQKADIIFACFGMNESFKGRDSLEAFKSTLDKFCKEVTSKKYNGTNSPMLILVSPIAHENVGGYYPDPAAHNKNLELYTSAMKDIANENKTGFIDLYKPSSENYKKDDHLTINGIHLNDKGYSEAAKWMTDALGLKYNSADADFIQLKKLADSKNQHFFYRWRAVNGEYIYGRRKNHSVWFPILLK